MQNHVIYRFLRRKPTEYPLDRRTLRKRVSISFRLFQHVDRKHLDICPQEVILCVHSIHSLSNLYRLLSVQDSDLNSYYYHCELNSYCFRIWYHAIRSDSHLLNSTDCSLKDSVLGSLILSFFFGDLYLLILICFWTLVYGFYAVNEIWILNHGAVIQVYHHDFRFPFHLLCDKLVERVRLVEYIWSADDDD